MDRKETLQRYQDAVREQRDFMKTAKERKAADANYDFTKDESYVKRENEINELSVWLQADRKLEEQERAFDHHVRSREDRRADKSEDAKEVERRNFVNYITTGSPDLMMQSRADMASNATTTGGYLVPNFVSAQVIQDLNALESVRKAGAQVVQVNGNTNIPIFQDAQANFIQEAQTITATDPTVARAQIQPNLLVCNTTYSWQLANRSAANVVDQIRASFVRGIAKKEASKFLYGSGTNEPQGLVAGATAAPVASGNTTASATTFTGAELTNLYYALRPEYASTATFIMSPGAASIARTLESTNGALLWYQNLAVGADTLFGRPVVIDPNMDTVTASKRPIVFSSVPDAYVIGEETGLSVLSDPYTAAGTGEIRLIVYKFVDGRVKVAAAAQAMVTHA